MNTTYQIWQSLRDAAPRTRNARIGLIAAIAAIAGLVVFAVVELAPTSPANEQRGDEPDRAGVITLSTEKLQSAQLHVTPCQMRELRDLRTVPGKITYNEAR